VSTLSKLLLHNKSKQVTKTRLLHEIIGIEKELG